MWLVKYLLKKLFKNIERQVNDQNMWGCASGESNMALIRKTNRHGHVLVNSGIQFVYIDNTRMLNITTLCKLHEMYIKKTFYFTK